LLLLLILSLLLSLYLLSIGCDSLSSSSLLLLSSSSLLLSLVLPRLVTRCETPNDNVDCCIDFEAIYQTHQMFKTLCNENGWFKNEECITYVASWTCSVGVFNASGTVVDVIFSFIIIVIVVTALRRGWFGERLF